MVMSMFDQLAGALDGRAGLILATFSLASVAFAVAVDSTKASPRVVEFTLGNGLQVLVIPDHRAPVVTQMIWYKVGAADEPRGSSGIAHFLEHLMFKGTTKHPPGEFSQTVLRVGGEENAFTNFDYTGYYQRVTRDQLATMMAFEADRMTGLVLTDENVLPERDVVLEEHNSRVANNPRSRLSEQMEAALYLNHPYGRPVIGWRPEIEKLNREDALAFYQRSGFRPFRRQIEIVDDPRLAGILPLTAAPHVPVIAAPR